MRTTDELPEILAPVGGKEQLVAAVRAGANAVYMGAKGFNARQNAENFTDEDLKNAVSYCHKRNVKVHVTLNTLIFDNEIKELISTVKSVAESGADAVIVQDLAVARIIKDCCPDLPMHASTQMAVHNSEGVKAVQELGFSRAVLARELTIDEIRSITSSAEIETETFIHGALCTSVSGMCYLSSMLGGRSGNRGLCAQPCRLNFVNRAGREYAISLKDMSYIENADELAKAGVRSFKIEGRMKRPEYVAAAVTALRVSLEGGKPDILTLKKVFSRSGFTDGYFTGKRMVSMYGIRTKSDVEASAESLSGLTGLYRNERQSVPFDAEAVLKENEPSVLTVTDGTNYVTVTGGQPEPAEKLRASEEYIRRSVSKTGGTPFVLDSLRAVVSGNVTLPASKLNDMRREALEKLLEERGRTEPWSFTEKSYSIPDAPERTKSALRARFENVSQMCCEDRFERIILPLDEIIRNKNLTEKLKDRLAAEIPPLIWEDDIAKTAKKLEELKASGVKNVICGSIGTLKLARSFGFDISGDMNLNITNSISAGEYEKLGVSDITVSFETAMARISKLSANVPTGIIAYGYLPLMKLRMCPSKTEKGCDGCNGREYLTDRANVKFMLMCRNRKYTELMNSVPLYVGDRKSGNVDFRTLYFTSEDKKTVNDIISLFVRGEEPSFAHTKGLYFREVK